MSEAPQMHPPDEANRQLLKNCHPPGWQNPTPADCYNMVVIGAGTAGLTVALGAAGLGARTALVERRLLGGDCLNVGCVPSKAIIRCARVAAQVRRAGHYGVNVPEGVEVDFGAVMERMRRKRAKISHHDSVSRLTEAGVDVFLGQGSFTSPETVEVGGQTLRFNRAVIATGASPRTPDVPGLREAGFLTNENIFELTERPPRLVVFGAGPLGCELAQTFQRLGSQVTIVEQKAHLLVKEDRDAAQILEEAFRRDGVAVRPNTKAVRVSVEGGRKLVHVETEGEEDVLEADEILVGAGRVPNIEGLNLEAAGVEYWRHGVRVNDRLQSSNRRVFAAGDICLRYKFTHTAEASARLVLRNALFYGRGKKSALTIPWCTYTDPEIAHVGMYEEDAREQGTAAETLIRRFQEVDRAITDGEEDGFVKMHVREGSDEILGATIVARHAGEMISEITTAMVGGVGLKTLWNVIHPYPTQAEAIKQVADQFNRRRLSPWVKGLFERFLAWRR